LVAGADLAGIDLVVTEILFGERAVLIADQAIQARHTRGMSTWYRLIGYENRALADRISVTTRSMPARSAPATK